MAEYNESLRDEQSTAGAGSQNEERAYTFLLPSMGDEGGEGKLVSRLFEPGEEVSEGEIIAEVETDKVMLEIPVDQTGRILSWLIEADETVSAGKPLVKMELLGQKEKVEGTEEEKPSQSNVIPPDEPVQATKPESSVTQDQQLESISEKTANRPLVPTGPSARRLAREIGIDITKVKGTGPRGRISKQDVKLYARMRNQNPEPTNTRESRALPDLSQFGAVRAEPLQTIEKATQQQMSLAWSEIPHAWLQEKIDITELEAARQRFKAQVKAEGGALTLTVILIKALAKVLDMHPKLNAALDVENDRIIYRDYCHIGVAVDTPQGLVVPKIESVNEKNLTRIACDLQSINERASQRRLTRDDLSGAGFTLSNLGSMGLTSILPIVNWPQVAILGVASSQMEPRMFGDEFKPRLMMPVTLGFDHRIVNGADGARFLRDLKALLEDPFGLLI